MKPNGAYPLNNWYLAAFSADVGNTPLARRICNESLVMYRTASGRAVALEDRCIHRGMPLSLGGECEGEIIRCPYHGLEFAASGACTKVPGQDKVPPGAQVKAFPVVERDKMIWVWPGDAAKANASQIVSHPYHNDPAWVWTTARLEVNANWQLLNDNLLDLSHLQYVHKKTIGGNPEEDARAQLKTARDGNRVVVSRWLPDMPAPPFHRQVCGFKGNVDRWQEIEFRPGVLQFYSGATDAGTGAFEGRREGGMHIRHFHAITPQTEHSTLYFFSVAHNFRIEDAELTGKMHKLAVFTFEEDKVVLEAQQARHLEDPDHSMIDIRNDVGTMHARRIIQELIAAERASAMERARAPAAE